MEIDHIYQKEGFVCPYCGHMHKESFDWPEYGENECESCEKEFKFSQEITVYYTTEKMEN